MSRLSRLRGWLWLGAAAWCLSTLLTSGPAFAQDDEDSTEDEVPSEPGVMVGPFTGARSQKINEDAIKALESTSFRIVPPGSDSDMDLGDDPDAFVELARELNLQAFIEANITMSKKGWVMSMKIRNGKDGAIKAEPKLKAPWLPGLLKKIDRELADLLDEPLSDTEAPEPLPEEEPEEMDAEEEADEEEEEEEEPYTGPRPSPLDASLGVGLVYREATYNQPVGDVFEDALQPPNIGPITARVQLHWYPGAHFTSGFAANIGIAASFYQSVGGVTQINNALGEPEDFDTSYTELNLGLRYRLDLDSLELGINAGWGLSDMTIDGDNEIPVTLTGVPGALGDPGVVPDAVYTYIRVGPDVMFDLGGFALGAGVYYRIVTIGSELGQWAEDRWFPNAEAQGIEAQVTALIPLSDSVNLLVGGDFRQYGLTMNTGPEAVSIDPATGVLGFNQAIAGGASDTYIGGFAGVQFVLPGSDGEDTPEPEEDYEDEEELDEELSGEFDASLSSQQTTL